MISVAFAQDGGGGASTLMTFLPLILIFVVFYLLLIRPQQKRMKSHREMLSALRRGDRVITGGGILGQIVRVRGDDELTVEIANGVRVNVLRSTVTGVVSKPEPARSAQEPEDDEEDAEAEPAEVEDKSGGAKAGRR